MARSTIEVSSMTTMSAVSGCSLFLSALALFGTTLIMEWMVMGTVRRVLSNPFLSMPVSSERRCRLSSNLLAASLPAFPAGAMAFAIDSLSLAAAFPVGAARRSFRSWPFPRSALWRSRILVTAKVLPVPGPPVMTVRFERTESAAAVFFTWRSCLSASFFSPEGSKRISRYFLAFPRYSSRLSAGILLFRASSPSLAAAFLS